MRTVLANGFFGGSNTGAVDQAHEFAQRSGFGDCGLAIGFATDVAFHEGAANLFGNRFPFVSLHVGNDHRTTQCRQSACRAFTEARCAARDNEYLAFDVHGFVSCK